MNNEQDHLHMPGREGMERSVRFQRDSLGLRTDCVEESPASASFDTPGPDEEGVAPAAMQVRRGWGRSMAVPLLDAPLQRRDGLPEAIDHVPDPLVGVPPGLELGLEEPDPLAQPVPLRFRGEEALAEVVARLR